MHIMRLWQTDQIVFDIVKVVIGMDKCFNCIWRLQSSTRHPSLTIAPRTDHDIPSKNRPLQTAQPHEKRLELKSQSFAPAEWKHKPQAMPSPQKRKRKHLSNRKFPRKQTPWNSLRPTPDGAVHRPDGTTNITSLHRTLKKKEKPYSQRHI